MERRAMICSSLRKRPDWASVVPALLQSPNPPRWKEARLETHDLALPLSLPGQPSHLAFRAIFLAPSDIGSHETHKRTERLFNLNGGRYVAIVLLMRQMEGVQESNSSAMMRLQLELIGGLEMPIIPVPTVESLPTAIKAFHYQLSTSAASRQLVTPARSLLPYCSDTGSLPEHAVNVISDITAGFKDLVSKATTPDGKQLLKDYLGEDADRVIRFWKDEYPIA
ncbi:hypothetical protein JX265_006450 [Neoarthrinium moseri]|uniref:Uncharacterized protein n=1 Tax=Neoarthrinium moseri TaxID=1658444 RepID=A0A9P9WMG1_9PEZI|nr:hypothetical protein JX265_006450 [Neoarthrinium moseri]